MSTAQWGLLRNRQKTKAGVYIGKSEAASLYEFEVDALEWIRAENGSDSGLVI